MANKKPNDGHVSLNAQQVAFMHQVIESEDKHRAKFSKSPPRRKRNPILGEPTPRSTAREEDVAQLKRAQLNHTRKQMALTPTIAGRRRAAERAAAVTAIQNVPTSTTVPGSANGASKQMATSSIGNLNYTNNLLSSRSNNNMPSGNSRTASRQSNGPTSGGHSARNSARNSARLSARNSARPSARPTGRSTYSEGSGGATDETPKVAQMRARKAWLERQLKEVEESLQAIPEEA